jgi:transcriptional regulator with XRE-family HTH domain
MAIRYDRIQELRGARGLSRRQVALRAGIRLQTLYDLERGKVENITVETLLKLARFFGVEPGYLLDSDIEPAVA